MSMQMLKIISNVFWSKVPWKTQTVLLMALKSIKKVGNKVFLDGWWITITDTVIQSRLESKSKNEFEEEREIAKISLVKIKQLQIV